MNEYIAYCGLDCEACEARLSTVNNDDALRQRVAREWSDGMLLGLVIGSAIEKKKDE